MIAIYLYFFKYRGNDHDDFLTEFYVFLQENMNFPHQILVLTNENVFHFSNFIKV